MACGSEATEVPLAEAFSTLYNGGFNGILMQNYRAVYAKNEPATTEMKLADGTPALDRPVYGYGFFYDGVPFIVAYIVIDDDAADEAKRTEM